MKIIVNIAGYLLVLVGCSLEAWLIYGILSLSYITAEIGARSGFPPRPRIVITSPATSEVSQPMIQIIGHFPKDIETITYDITNVAGKNANQVDWQRRGFVTDRFFDQAKANRMQREMFTNSFKPLIPGSRMKRPESFFTTNFFQIYDVNLAKGKNCIIIHVKDKNDIQYSTKRYYTLDYSHDKTPPVGYGLWCRVAGDRHSQKWDDLLE
jgi:hypothetical protein